MHLRTYIHLGMYVQLCNLKYYKGIYIYIYIIHVCVCMYFCTCYVRYGCILFNVYVFICMQLCVCVYADTFRTFSEEEFRTSLIGSAFFFSFLLFTHLPLPPYPHSIFLTLVTSKAKRSSTNLYCSFSLVTLPHLLNNCQTSPIIFPLPFTLDKGNPMSLQPKGARVSDDSTVIHLNDTFLCNARQGLSIFNLQIYQWNSQNISLLFYIYKCFCLKYCTFFFSHFN